MLCCYTLSVCACMCAEVWRLNNTNSWLFPTQCPSAQMGGTTRVEDRVKGPVGLCLLVNVWVGVKLVLNVPRHLLFVWQRYEWVKSVGCGTRKLFLTHLPLPRLSSPTHRGGWPSLCFSDRPPLWKADLWLGRPLLPSVLWTSIPAARIPTAGQYLRSPSCQGRVQNMLLTSVLE